MRQTAFDQFHPRIAQWFQKKIGQPTDVQQRTWPMTASGEHLLITAPTGSGKTMAAFLWALNQLITGKWSPGHTSVLYVSPLRALNYDIQQNLLSPLDELSKVFEKAGETFPDIHVLTRSGDTPPQDRRQMIHHPPEILITTPESLNLLLSSKGGRHILSHIETVILDEIHEVYGTKRGVYLMTAVDRLVWLCGEFQRIALSATVEPLEAVARFIGGFKLVGEQGNHQYEARPVSLIQSKVKKEYDLRVFFSGREVEEGRQDFVWVSLVKKLKETILKNRSTLIFVNSRRLCEMLTLLINENEEEPVAYAHHGSLSLEIRSEVERKLKAGALRAIVATHSLELGIDIGTLDEVVLVQSPFSISSAVQRVGRSGHQVNQVSQGLLYPTHPKDLLEAAVLTFSIRHHEIESIKAVLCPLDVLAQIIVSAVGMETWNIDSLYEYLKTSYPYRNLRRDQFDLVLNMLAGRYAESRIRELRPLITIDRLDNTVMARRGALQTFYLSGGVIPDRGYFHLRHQETGALIGDLDEEFVWEASVGDTFTFGTQNWKIHRITHNDVFVLPTPLKGTAAPFWKGEENGRGFHFSERIGQFLEKADQHLEDSDFLESLKKVHCMEPEASKGLIDFLKQQKEATGCSLPHRHHVVVEFVSTGPGGTPQAVIHTLWGGRVNRPLAMAIDAAWQARFGHRLELYVSNDSIVLQLPHEISGAEVLSLVDCTRIESLLRGRLEGSGFFGAKFRECAGRALLLPKGNFHQRMPLWLNRLRSQQLLEAVMKYDDFPILLESWRTCIQDEFDLESLKQVLTELESGSISWSEVHTLSPSPFAQGDWWRQVNQYMYRDDTPRPEKRSKLQGSLLHEIIFNTGLRPTVSRELVNQFELKRKRLSPGYSPQTPREIIDWVSERVAIPKKEWEDLQEAIRRDHGIDLQASQEELQKKVLRVYPPGANEFFVASRELLPHLLNAFYEGEKDVRVESTDNVPISVETSGSEGEEWVSLLGQWLQFYGPVTIEFIQSTLGVNPERLQLGLEDLIDAQKIIQGHLKTEGRYDEICDSENFEILLRLVRRKSIPSFEPLKIEALPLFLADYQGITKPKENIDGLRDCIEQLLCYPAEAATWESEIFPARLHPYDPSWLDTLMQEGDLLWLGSEGRHIAFCFETDMDLLQEDPDGERSSLMEGDISRSLFPDPLGRYDLSALRRLSKSGEVEMAKRLWEEVWQGRVTNDTFISLRRAIMGKFKFPDNLTERVKRTRPPMRRLKRSIGRKEERFFAGNWRLVPSPEYTGDLLEKEELRKDRVRLLLDRYGILFRELLQREFLLLRWTHVFRALRIMELSGEVISGIFFHGIPGPQFISHQAFRRLQQRLPEDAIYCINAADPASVCGISLDPLRGMVPPRLPTTHLVYRGTKLVIVLKRNGKDLRFLVPSNDPDLPHYVATWHRLLSRKFQPLRRIDIETINDEVPFESPYLPALRTSFEVTADYRNVTLYRKMR
jgi:ATP-dependent Lhr-like helicase